MILDIVARTLSHGDTSIRLRPTCVRALRLLAEVYPQSIPFSKALEALYSPFSDRANLSTCIATLRRSIAAAEIPLTVEGGSWRDLRLSEAVAVVNADPSIILPADAGRIVLQLLQSHGDVVLAKRVMPYFDGCSL